MEQLTLVSGYEPEPAPDHDPYAGVPQWEETCAGDIEMFVDRCGYDYVLSCVLRHAPSEVVGSAPARWSDPETSQAAAKAMPDVGRFSKRSRQAMLLSNFMHHPMTDQEATIRVLGSHAAPSAFDGCRRRCSDLRAVAYLSDTGRRKRNPGSDDEAVVWQVTVAGERALENLLHTGWSR